MIPAGDANEVHEDALFEEGRTGAGGHRRWTAVASTARPPSPKPRMPPACLTHEEGTMTRIVDDAGNGIFRSATAAFPARSRTTSAQRQDALLAFICQ
ncbi:hypothetical protein GCM10010275_18530 [Streptomyces litmocidini]|nr:hypothetical protein GCM10010275_18530 [Streptomyces litmocidini]